MKKDNLIYGLRPVIEAIEAGQEIDKVFVKKGSQGPLHSQLMGLMKDRETPFQFVPLEKLNRMTGKNHQGVVAFISPITYYSLNELVTRLYEDGTTPLLFILDRVTDVRNFGAIARTAECMGVHGLVIPIKESAQVNEDAIKTSAGALMNIPVCREKSLKNAVKFLRDSGLKVYYTSHEAPVLMQDADFRVPAAIVMGSEDEGVSRDLMRLSDQGVKIPMSGTTGSLNVSVAAGMVMYEVSRQRG
jgi:23S rRNA (guanosine2251-2'-O)-methyltransferase